MTSNEAVNGADCGKRLRCMVTMDQPPGRQLENVRKPETGLLGWFARTEERLVRKIRPETQLSSHVRGSKVAIDYLIQAFLQYSERAKLAFAVPDIKREQFEQWAVAGMTDDGRRPVEIYSATQLLGKGLEAIAPDIWLDLAGNESFAMRMRDQLSSEVYPIVTVQHGLSGHYFLYDKFLRAMLTPSYACDSLVCTSRACREALVKILDEISASFNRQFGTTIRYEGRFDLIPLCVDTDQLHPRDKSALRKQLGIPQDTLLLLYVGYLSQTKADLAPLLPMIRRLVDANLGINLSFVIAGTGPASYAKGLSGLIEDIGLAKTITLLHEVSDKRKEQLFGAADILVAPCDSMQECFGLTPVEAMACGLPQVVADWNGYRDTVSNGETGFLIPTCWGRCDGELRGSGDIQGWVYDHIVQGQSIAVDVACMQEHLQLLIRRPELRAAMSERSRVRAVAEFSYATAARRYDGLLTELAAVAGTLQRYPKTRRFDQPAYFDYFRHFATKELKDDCLLRKASDSVFSLAQVIRMAQTELLGISVIDDALLDHLLEVLSTAEKASEVISVGQLISLTSARASSRDTIRRHILFLLKHGQVTI
jgi:D-inositol-3-phosphate glycosyltransferase